MRGRLAFALLPLVLSLLCLPAWAGTVREEDFGVSEVERSAAEPGGISRRKSRTGVRCSISTVTMPYSTPLFRSFSSSRMARMVLSRGAISRPPLVIISFAKAR